MLTCPKCNKDMYPVCGRKDCVCHTRIPVGELPMKDIDLLFGKIYVPGGVGNFIWHWMLYLNVGYWIEKFVFKVSSNKLINIAKYTGIMPRKIIFELQECPYCGYKNTYDYWQDRNITQTYPNGFSASEVPYK
jgi:hypothetical protein